ncbi:MAG: putative DNA binding domain-containing protein, partial [Spirochaetales bacterium]|nr:putative DNA binding domain-containing protein [Spirochaetales bacterium]
MTKIERLLRQISEGESVHQEFKKAQTTLPKSLFETVCAFLNRDGGIIYLGVDDNGTITGITSSKVDQLKDELITLSNNPTKLDPPFILFPEVYDLEGKKIIRIQVPESSSLHKTNGNYYDRSSDGDFILTQADAIARMVNRKNSYYTENRVYPYVTMEDFNPGLFERSRNLIRGTFRGHPWLELSNEQLVVRAGFYRKDRHNSVEGYTLGAVLLFGRDEVIKSILPHYKTDALLREKDLYRYDDRAYIDTNLIDSYDQLMAFIAKHLPDPFYLDGDHRISLRENLFREIIANTLVHREYMSAEPARLIIYTDRVESTNGNNPHNKGFINPDSFTPFSKNPTLMKFFVQLGWVDELGSGVVNVNRFHKLYSPGSSAPVFEEGGIFKVVIPLNPKITDQVTPQVERVLKVMEGDLPRNEM